MTQPSTEEAIEVCEKHLADTKSFGTEIEAFLVRYLLVIICAEIEQSVLSMTVERVRRVGDNQVTGFVDSTVEKLFRRVRTGEMGGLLGYFDKDIEKAFMEKINATEEQAAFNNIVNNRHNMAHGKATVQMTFKELRESYIKCQTILNEFAKALS